MTTTSPTERTDRADLGDGSRLIATGGKWRQEKEYCLVRARWGKVPRDQDGQIEANRRGSAQKEQRGWSYAKTWQSIRTGDPVDDLCCTFGRTLLVWDCVYRVGSTATIPLTKSVEPVTATGRRRCSETGAPRSTQRMGLTTYISHLEVEGRSAPPSFERHYE